LKDKFPKTLPSRPLFSSELNNNLIKPLDSLITSLKSSSDDQPWCKCLFPTTIEYLPSVGKKSNFPILNDEFILTTSE
jgi:hypothetical protein